MLRRAAQPADVCARVRYRNDPRCDAVARSDGHSVKKGLGVMQLRRRDCLLKCAALGSLRVLPGLAVADAVLAFEIKEGHALLHPTPRNEVGPFYKRLAPNNAHLRNAGDPGLPLSVGGRVLDIRGDSLPASKVEIWQADHLGSYDLQGFRYRASLSSDASGQYSFDSVMPGHYPGRVCQHIHYVVTAPGHKPLTTQLYFATDPAFEGDPDHNYTRDPILISRELVRPVTLAGDPDAIHAHVDFDIVLEPL
jgi:protocatechuate 3,4-dioxygenase beta subunit